MVDNPSLVNQSSQYVDNFICPPFVSFTFIIEILQNPCSIKMFSLPSVGADPTHRYMGVHRQGLNRPIVEQSSDYKGQ